MPTVQPHPVRHPLRQPLQRQQGLSLVELMVGLVVGLLLVAGLALMFANASRSTGELERSMRHIESARHALDLLAEDLSMAGYYGTAAARRYADTVSPCADGAAHAADINARHVTASPATLPLAVRGYTPDEAATLECLSNHKAGTPVLVLRRLETQALPAASAPAGVAVLQASHHPLDTQPYTASATGTQLGLRDRAGLPNTVRRLVVRLYFVARCSDCSGAGDGIATLKRIELRGDRHVEVPVAEGIDQIAFDYGFDTDGDGLQDLWWGLNGGASATESASAAAAGWGNVVAVRISVLSRNTEATPGFTDDRRYRVGLRGAADVEVGPFSDTTKRRVSSTTVRLHSVAGLRGSP